MRVFTVVGRPPGESTRRGRCPPLATAARTRAPAASSPTTPTSVGAAAERAHVGGHVAGAAEWKLCRVDLARPAPAPPARSARRGPRGTRRASRRRRRGRAAVAWRRRGRRARRRPRAFTRREPAARARASAKGTAVSEQDEYQHLRVAEIVLDEPGHRRSPRRPRERTRRPRRWPARASSRARAAPRASAARATAAGPPQEEDETGQPALGRDLQRVVVQVRRERVRRPPASGSAGRSSGSCPGPGRRRAGRAPCRCPACHM